MTKATNLMRENLLKPTTSTTEGAILFGVAKSHSSYSLEMDSLWRPCWGKGYGVRPRPHQVCAFGELILTIYFLNDEFSGVSRWNSLSLSFFSVVTCSCKKNELTKTLLGLFPFSENCKTTLWCAPTKCVGGWKSYSLPQLKLKKDGIRPMTGHMDGYTRTGYPRTGYPRTGYPRTGYPRTGYPTGYTKHYRQYRAHAAILTGQFA